MQTSRRCCLRGFSLSGIAQQYSAYMYTHTPVAPRRVHMPSVQRPESAPRGRCAPHTLASTKPWPIEPDSPVGITSHGVHAYPSVLEYSANNAADWPPITARNRLRYIY
jgi:hypothetical protein